MRKNFVNKIVNDEKYINNEIFIEYFAYQNHLVLARDLYKVNQAENEEIIKERNDALIY